MYLTNVIADIRCSQNIIRGKFSPAQCFSGVEQLLEIPNAAFW
jgi:hypothetical protein